MISHYFSWTRLWALVIKEFNQLKRDQTTFIMIISIPIVQLVLFGLAINTNPRHIPSAIVNFDNGPFSRTLIKGLENTSYFDFLYQSTSEKESNYLLATHQALFVLQIPPDFSRNIVRQKYPAVLLEADGTDPVSIVNAVAAANAIMPTVFQYDLVGSLPAPKKQNNPVDLRIHTRYNPNAITQYNTVPGLIGVILTMTLVMVTAMALAREYEQGTLEGLLITPALPIEVILGKIIPFVIVGYLQMLVIFLLIVVLFHIPIQGSLLLLALATFPFIIVNLLVGITFSTLAKTQLEASQLSIFFFLPSILLSGFAFPFYGMPFWAEWIGNILPLTHFVNITRGIILKGNAFMEVWPHLWPILLFMVIALVLAVNRYRQTLD